jgi:hypothetical protein
MGDSVKEKIVMSTLKLISEKGYKSTTTRNIAEEAGCIWNLKEDLIMLAHEYHKNFTEEKAKIMMGLRSPEIFEEVKEYLMKIPKGFKEVLIKYFEKMYEKGLLNTDNFELLAFAFMSLNFGFILMNVSYGNKLIGFGDSEFVKKTIEIFVRGVEKSD